MILTVVLPDSLVGVRSAEVHAVHCSAGEELKRGGKILDLKVDLSSVFEHDCPPVSFYRLAACNRLWVRDVSAKVGATALVGETLVLCSTTPDEDLNTSQQQPARVSVIAILGHADIWA
jgi:hypothetical protein